MNEIETPWEARRLKYLFDYSLSSVDRHVDSEQTPVKVCHYPFVYKNERLTQTLGFPAGTCTQEEYERFRLFRGDILITKDSESPLDIGVPAFVVDDLDNVVCGYHLGVLRSRTTVDTGYFFRFLQSDFVKGYFYCEASGITRYGLGKDSVLNLQLPLPPLHEQRLISCYLDKKTQQIDTLIEKIEKKIELLKEQRTSLINHYVTKGLDPNVEMKDSGVEWIGKIPKHWEVKKLKYVASVDLSSVDRHEYDDEDQVLICHYPDVYKNEFINSKTPLPTGTCSKEEVKKFSLKGGDILITKDSESPDDIGIPALVTEDLENTVCGYHLAIIRKTTQEIDSEYLYRFIESTCVKDYFYISSSGITRYGLGKGSIETLSVLEPPVGEQPLIVSKLRHVSSLTRDLSILLERQLERLKEYRQSLISSVVTGKVRVTEDMV